VTNWPDCNEALRQRGDITIWFTEEALVAWHPAKTGARGRPQEYSVLAIEIALFIRQVFYLPLRRTWRKFHLTIDEHHQVLATSSRRTSVIPRPRPIAYLNCRSG
jgi:hypothetical protein